MFELACTIALDHQCFAADPIDTTINRVFNILDMNWQQEYMIQLMWLFI